MICTFFGHRKCSEKIEPALRLTIEDLINNKNVDVFYVGNHGDFDRLVRKNLMLIKEKYPHINYAVVLAYMPVKTNKYKEDDYSDTIYLDGLETIPPKFAINKRNAWMINESDFVVTYVRYSTGGAAHFKEFAEKKGKIVINL